MSEPTPRYSDINTTLSNYNEAIKKLNTSMSSDFLSTYRKALESSSMGQKSLDAFSLYSSSNATSRLKKEIATLEAKAQKQADEISKHTADKEKATERIDKLRATVDELNKKKNTQHIINSVSLEAHQKIEEDEGFRSLFSSEAEVDAFVVSVDIRRSTELMLKARSPKLFADFITTLCKDLEEIFKAHWAIVDKFTGDGILCFFPSFFSGDDAGYLALKASKLANEAFQRRYKEFRTSFTTVLNDVGLGIGIDYGKVHLVRMAGALTIVGQTVVYACRMGGAPAGKIFLNQPAYEITQEKYEALTIIDETLINIKSEGYLLAYDVTLSEKEFSASSPEWMK